MATPYSTNKTPQNKFRFIRGLFALTLVALFVFGSIGITAFTNEATSDLRASVLQSTETRARRRVLDYLEKKIVKPSAEKVSCDGISTDFAQYKGEFIARNIAIDVFPEQAYKVSLYLKNTGTSPWVGDASGCLEVPFMRLGTARSHDHKSLLYNSEDSAWRGANRIAMKEPRVEPGEIATFTFSSKAASKNDIYKEFFQPVIEQVGWLEDRAVTLAMDVRVGQYNDELLYKAFLLNNFGRASTLDISGPQIVHVNLTDQKAQIAFGNTVVREYTVSTGANKTPTPTGRYKILRKDELRIGAKAPHYRMPNFQLITPQGVGFHALPYLANDNGTFWNEALNHIGRRVSHGCVRLLPEDAQELFAITQIGTEVVIHY